MTEPRTPSGRSGRQLWELLPQVYRTRDREQGGDLAVLVEAFGEVLEGIRGTLDQRLAEVAPAAHHPAYPGPDDEVRQAQDWLLPYFADLLDAHLRSPHADGRRTELQRAVRWRRSKGTLPGAAEAAGVVSQAAIAVREGRSLVAVTPRVDLVLLPEKAVTARPRDPAETPEGQPLAAAGHPGLPSVTPDTRRPTRSVAAAPTAPGAHRRSAPPVLDLRRRLERDPALGPATTDLVLGVYTDAEVVAIAADGDVLALRRIDGVGEAAATRILEVVGSLAADVVWRHRDPRAVPCFRDGHEDPARRTPDARSPSGGHGRHHPRRLVVFHPPAPGFFPPPDHGVARQVAADLDVATEGPTVTEGARLGAVTVAASGLHVFRRCVIGTLTVGRGQVLLDRVTVRGAITLDAPAAHRFVDVVQLAGDARVEVADGARLEALRCGLGAVTTATAGAPRGAIDEDSDVRMPEPCDETDTLVAVDSLLAAVSARGRVTLDATTVLGDLAAATLRTSEALLAGSMALTGDDTASCLRFSRHPALGEAALADLAARQHDLARSATTTRPVRFVPSLSCDGDPAAAAYGAPGCGVLADASPSAITAGAEDGGELGAYHHRAHQAGAAAMATKLGDLLPVGVEPVLVQDLRLLTRPPGTEGGPT